MSNTDREPIDTTLVRPIEEHPMPLDQDEIDAIWEDDDWLDGEPPHIDKVHEEFTITIAEYGEWHVFRVRYPFGYGDKVYCWNRMFGEGFAVIDEEGTWHQMVNLFAEIVDEEGDCRDAEYSNSLMPSGSTDQRCKSCGGKWSVG